MKKILVPFLLIAIWSCESNTIKSTIDNSIHVPDGFVVEKLYTPNEHGQGSWVSLTTDDKGRLIASDQYGSIYTMPVPEPGQGIDSTRIEILQLEIGYAQGLLWAYNSLYVMVNRSPRDDASFSSGLFRVTDSDNDGKLDKVTQLQSFQGAGEHGPHAIIKGPDNMLYLIAGNHTDIPEDIDTVVPDIWGEDNIVPIIKDPRGHANSRTAPGGWIARTDSTGKRLELYTVGFRNSYDMAFHANGELVVFDSDMEWDMGSPWYRPIRVLHAFPGAEFGWRTGTGKFPSYYPDNLPSIVDIGQGSPTGVIMGDNFHFPKKYRNGVFILDWSFGTMYYVDLKTQGATFTGTAEEFLSGKPLPLTDITAYNGDMYFAIGGRRLESGLYRVSYTGADKSEEAPDASLSEEMSLRRELEGLGANASENGVNKIWEALGHEDRFVRFAARTALERLEDHSWIERIPTEDNLVITMQSLIALARLGVAVNSEDSYQHLLEIPFSQLPMSQKIDYIRTCQLLIIRYDISEASSKKFSEILAPHFPSGDHDLDRELLKLLSTLQADGIIQKALDLVNNPELAATHDFIDESTIERSEQYGDIIALMRRNNPRTRKLGYLEAISVIKKGWNKKQMESFFTSFNDVFTSTGGASYKGFARKILERALENLPVSDKQYYSDMSGVALEQMNANTLADLPQPKGPGRAWTLKELKALSGNLSDANPENGKLMYQASLCSSCHVIQGEGGNVGPDLSTLGNRFSAEDIIRSILFPDEAVSDQYQISDVLKNDSTNMTGRIISEQQDTLILNINPFDPGVIRKIPLSDISSVKGTNKSVMPPALVNRLNEQEVKDLLAYLIGQTGN